MMTVDRVGMSRGLKETTALQYVSHCLEGIKNESLDGEDPYSPLMIHAFIHKIVLTVGSQNIARDRGTIHRLFDPYFIDKVPPQQRRMDYYQERWIKHLPACDIYIFTFPIGRQAPFWIEIHTKESCSLANLKELLIKIRKDLPKAGVSSIDYTIDLPAWNSRCAENLFWALKKCLYIPYRRGAQIYGGQLTMTGNCNRMNTVYRVGDTKIYERGSDGNRTGDYWDIKDIDRVRLEYSAPRHRLRKHGISRIGDLITGISFYEMNKDIYHFKCFEGSTELPVFHKDYRATDNYGNGDCFQLEHINHRGFIKGLNQYVKDMARFEGFKAALMEVMMQADSEWARICRKSI